MNAKINKSLFTFERLTATGFNMLAQGDENTNLGAQTLAAAILLRLDAKAKISFDHGDERTEGNYGTLATCHRVFVLGMSHNNADRLKKFRTAVVNLMLSGDVVKTGTPDQPEIKGRKVTTPHFKQEVGIHSTKRAVAIRAFNDAAALANTGKTINDFAAGVGFTVKRSEIIPAGWLMYIGRHLSDADANAFKTSTVTLNAKSRLGDKADRSDFYTPIVPKDGKSEGMATVTHSLSSFRTAQRPEGKAKVVEAAITIDKALSYLFKLDQFTQLSNTQLTAMKQTIVRLGQIVNAQGKVDPMLKGEERAKAQAKLKIVKENNEKKSPVEVAAQNAAERAITEAAAAQVGDNPAKPVKAA